MALIDALHMATRAMDAQRSGIEVAGHNISNVNTPGYARRVLDLRPSAPLTAGSAGSGVDAIGVRALRDVFIERRLLQALPSEAREAAIADGLAVVEALLGAPGGSIDGALTQFFDAFAGLAADPTSPAARQDVISRAQSLANAFATLSTQLNAARQDADLSIRDGIDEVNRLAANIAELNQSIAQTSEPSTKAFFRDRQQAEVDRLAELIDISTMARGDGGIDITFGNGRSLVIGANPHLLSAIPSPPNGLVAIQNDGATVTSEITSGRVGGALQVRDVLLPDYLTRLDTLAFEVVEEVNALHTAGFDLDGNAAGVFFTALGATAGAAGAMALDPTLAANGRLVAAATTLESIRDALFSSFSTRVAGTYVFSGIASTQPPYVKNPDGTVAAYQGNAGTASIDIDRAVSVQATFSADAILRGSDAANLFSELDNLAAAIRAGDVTGIDAGRDALDRAFERAVATQAQVGISLRSIDTGRVQIDARRRASTQEVSRHEDANLAKTVTDLAAADTAYQAAIGALGRTSQLSLLDYLR